MIGHMGGVLVSLVVPGSGVGSYGSDKLAGSQASGERQRARSRDRNEEEVVSARHGCQKVIVVPCQTSACKSHKKEKENGAFLVTLTLGWAGNTRLKKKNTIAHERTRKTRQHIDGHETRIST